MNPIDNLLAAVEDHMKATGDGTWKPLIDAVRDLNRETPKGVMLSRAELENIRVQIRGAGLSDMAINAGHLISHIDALNSELADRICIAKADLSADQLTALADLLDDIWDGRDTDAEMLRDMARELEDESEADDESEEGNDDDDDAP
jgi:hypothetical protein